MTICETASSLWSCQNAVPIQNILYLESHGEFMASSSRYHAVPMSSISKKCLCCGKVERSS